MIIAGLFLGFYVGVYVMLVGGVIQFVDALMMDPVSATGIAVGIARVVLASATGAVSAALMVLPGYLMLFK